MSVPTAHATHAVGTNRLDFPNSGSVRKSTGNVDREVWLETAIFSAETRDMGVGLLAPREFTRFRWPCFPAKRGPIISVGVGQGFLEGSKVPLERPVFLRSEVDLNVVAFAFLSVVRGTALHDIDIKAPTIPDAADRLRSPVCPL